MSTSPNGRDLVDDRAASLARPSPAYGEAWRSLKVVDPGQTVSADRTSSAGADVVAALLCCTCRTREAQLAHSSLAKNASRWRLLISLRRPAFTDPSWPVRSRSWTSSRWLWRRGEVNRRNGPGGGGGTADMGRSFTGTW